MISFIPQPEGAGNYEASSPAGESICGRELLWRNNYLRPRRLTSEQRFVLEPMARTAVVTERRVDSLRALEPAGVRLVYVPPDSKCETAPASR